MQATIKAFTDQLRGLLDGAFTPKDIGLFYYSRIECTATSRTVQYLVPQISQDLAPDGGRDIAPEILSASNLGGVEGNRLLTRKVLLLHSLNGACKEKRLPLKQGKPTKHEEAVTRFILVAGFIEIEKIHCVAPWL